MGVVEGWVESGFGPVREAFETNFTRHGEIGAAVCMHVHGRVVVDLWGGVADPATGRPYTADTLQLVFSTTKGAVAICAHLLAQRGQLDLDAPVARYWPEFASAGKAAIPVRWLLTHQAGLAAVGETLELAEFLAWEPVVEKLAAQEPLWEPGSDHGYHAVTYGFLVGEVIRRVSGRSVGRFFADEVAAPLGLEFWIGLPEAEQTRVAPLLDFPAVTDDAAGEPDPLLEALLDPTSLAHRAFLNPPLAIAALNHPRIRAAELPALNGVCTARSLSRLYAACIGAVDGVRLLSAETVDGARATQVLGPDRVNPVVDMHHATGFSLPTAENPMAGPGSFGHAGLGGSLGFAHPELGLAVGYLMNQCQSHAVTDPRRQGLVEAAVRCLGGVEPTTVTPDTRW
ncbi:MAG: beta-lactamase family protein [Acidimicrobiales bacterium]|nr:beta-lactamase family protein [Acidimicrobiales bacterium]